MKPSKNYRAKRHNRPIYIGKHKKIYRAFEHNRAFWCGMCKYYHTEICMCWWLFAPMLLAIFASVYHDTNYYLVHLFLQF